MFLFCTPVKQGALWKIVWPQTVHHLASYRTASGPPLVFDNNDSVDNVLILTIGPITANTYYKSVDFLFFEVIHHGAVCAQKVCVLPTSLKPSYCLAN